MKKALTIAMALLLASSALFATGSKEQPAATAAPAADQSGIPAHKSDLIIGSAADINNLDLQKQQDQINNIVLKTTHQTLVRFTNEGAGHQLGVQG